MKSTTGRTKNLMIFLAIFIVSVFVLKQVGIVIAQNESNITGYVISNLSNVTREIDNFSFRNETFDLIENISINDTFVINETLENVTDNETLNETSNETLPEDLIINETQENETIIPNETNETFPEPVVTNFDIDLNYPQKITRGEIRAITGIVTNIGSKARNVVLIWKLPDGFEIVSGYLREFCGTLETNDVCSSEISLKTNLSTPLGLNEIKIVISYEA